MNKVSEKARAWMESKSSGDFLGDDEYCATRDIFQARLDKMRLALESKIGGNPELIYPLTALVGEIGNNSYDHNLGKWRDIPGIFFDIDYTDRVIALADRGQGIYATIKKAVPGVADDLQAVEIAFTKRISGRQPEKRGNGLKFVAMVAQKLELDLFLRSGRASVRVNRDGMKFGDEKEEMSGVLAIIKF